MFFAMISRLKEFTDYKYCLFFLMLISSNTAEATWVNYKIKQVRCKEKSSFKGKVCLVENVKKGVGTIVSVYNPRHHWVASGHIVRKFGRDALIFFKGKSLPKFRKFYLEDSESIKWKHSYFDAHKW